jgi:hypothetical protein
LQESKSQRIRGLVPSSSTGVGAEANDAQVQEWLRSSNEEIKELLRKRTLELDALSARIDEQMRAAVADEAEIAVLKKLYAESQADIATLMAALEESQNEVTAFKNMLFRAREREENLLRESVADGSEIAILEERLDMISDLLSKEREASARLKDLLGETLSYEEKRRRVDRVEQLLQPLERLRRVSSGGDTASQLLPVPLRQQPPPTEPCTLDILAPLGTNNVAEQLIEKSENAELEHARQQVLWGLALEAIDRRSVDDLKFVLDLGFDQDIAEKPIAQPRYRVPNSLEGGKESYNIPRGGPDGAFQYWHNLVLSTDPKEPPPRNANGYSPPVRLEGAPTYGSGGLLEFAAHRANKEDPDNTIPYDPYWIRVLGPGEPGYSRRTVLERKINGWSIDAVAEVLDVLLSYGIKWQKYEMALNQYGYPQNTESFDYNNLVGGQAGYHPVRADFPGRMMDLLVLKGYPIIPKSGASWVTFQLSSADMATIEKTFDYMFEHRDSGADPTITDRLQNLFKWSDKGRKHPGRPPFPDDRRHLIRTRMDREKDEQYQKVFQEYLAQEQRGAFWKGYDFTSPRSGPSVAQQTPWKMIAVPPYDNWFDVVRGPDYFLEILEATLNDRVKTGASLIGMIPNITTAWGSGDGRARRYNNETPVLDPEKLLKRLAQLAIAYASGEPKPLPVDAGPPFRDPSELI